ncbi:MAG: (deoxy)nucleoside triphosphate pyrophosphohydrolase [Planctomyces sp.]|nr:(deoxy)nucleoside triphosphate pyrophosphohydrolase [Planctomyces sp.]
MADRKRIGIAVVESAGQYLVGLRPEGVPLAGLSEFPGGKCESDETPRACAVRECREETGLMVVPSEQLATVEYSYPHGDVELHFWRCGLAPGMPPQARPTGTFRWVSIEEMKSLTFPEANRSVLEHLIPQM